MTRRTRTIAVGIALLLLLLLLGGGPLLRWATSSGAARPGPGEGSSAALPSNPGPASDIVHPPVAATADPSAAAGPSETDAAPPADAPTAADETPPDDPPGYFVEGTVIGADGRELAGVAVELHLHRAAEARDGALEEMFRRLDALDDEEMPVATDTTDRAGRFSLAAGGPGEYRLGASLPPLARGVEGPFQLTERDPAVELLVVLGGGLSLAGIVVGPDGLGIGGAEVSLLDQLEGELPGRHFHTHRAVTAADGSFSIDGLEARRYILTAVADGFARTLLPSIAPPLEDLRVEVGEGRHVAIRVVRGVAPLEPFGELFPTPAIEGAGEPVAGAQVYALNPVGFAVATTDELGIARLRIAGEDASLRITADGYRESRVRRLSIPEGIQEDPIDVPISPVAPVEGIVMRADDSPAAGARILEVGGGLLGGGLRSFRADDEGRFSYAGGGALIAELDGEVSALPDPRRGAAAELRLAPTTAISGRLVGPGGWPAAGAEVRLSLGGFVGGGSESVLRFAGATTAAVTRADGSFRLEGVPAWGNAFELAIYAEGSPDIRIAVAGSIGPYGEIALGDIPLGEEAILEGRVVAPGGAPPPAAAIVLELPGAPPVRRDPASGALRGGVRVLVAEDGRFRVDRLPTAGEPLVLHVLAPPYLEATREVTLAAGRNEPIEIVLVEGGAARVHVTGADGLPRAAAQVEVRGRQTSRRTRTGADGVALVTGLAPGDYEIIAEASNESGHATTRIAPGIPAEVGVTVE